MCILINEASELVSESYLKTLSLTTYCQKYRLHLKTPCLTTYCQKYKVQVDKWSPRKHISELFSNIIQLWIQIHNLPVEYRNNHYGSRFAVKAGKIIQNSENEEGNSGRDEIQKFVKFKVEIDLLKPVVPGWTLGQGSGTPLWIDFKYERLPNICFTCGRFDHERRLCPVLSAHMHSTRLRTVKFGLWLRAEHQAVERLLAKKPSPGKSCTLSTGMVYTHTRAPESGTDLIRKTVTEPSEPTPTAAPESGADSIQKIVTKPSEPTPVNPPEPFKFSELVMEEITVGPKTLDTLSSKLDTIAKAFGLSFPKKPNTADLNYGQLGKCKERIIPLEKLKSFSCFKSFKGEKRNMIHEGRSIWRKTLLHTEGSADMGSGLEHLIEVIVSDTLHSVTFEDTSARTALQLRRQQ